MLEKVGYTLTDGVLLEEVLQVLHDGLSGGFRK